MGIAAPWLSFRRCSPRLSDEKDSRQDDLVGSTILDKRLGLRIGAGGIGGMELRFREGLYTCISEAAVISNSERIGELCRREMVGLELTKVGESMKIIISLSDRGLGDGSAERSS
jgi:hypothetical protein